MQYFDHGGNHGISIPPNRDFSVNINPLGCPVDVSQIDFHTLAENYPDNECKILKEKLSYKLNVNPSQIVCGNGASDLIMRICLLLKPRKVLTLSPTFSEYERCVKLAGGEISEKDFDTAFICRPNNPDGRMIDENYIIELLKRGITVILDECFIEFTPFPSLIPLIDKFPNLIILNAFTKIYAMAGLRLGYAVCSDNRLIENLQVVSAVWSVSAIAQAVGIKVLEADGFIEKTRDLIDSERDFLCKNLRDSGVEVFDSTANFMLIKSDLPLYEPLLEKGIAVRNCSNFNGLNKYYSRIGIKNHEDNTVLINAISNIL
jgi:threonine-phosphate decarboxylase